MAKLLNKDPQLYAAERDRFLRELRQFHNGQRCDPRVFRGLILGFLSRKGQPVASLPPGDGAAGGAGGGWPASRAARGERKAALKEHKRIAGVNGGAGSPRSHPGTGRAPGDPRPAPEKTGKPPENAGPPV